MPWQVGYDKDFQASRDIDNSVNNAFRWISDDLEEIVKRITNPLAIYRSGKVGRATCTRHECTGSSANVH